jgi:hypothetical protein
MASTSTPTLTATTSSRVRARRAERTECKRSYCDGDRQENLIPSCSDPTICVRECAAVN